MTHDPRDESRPDGPKSKQPQALKDDWITTPRTDARPSERGAWLRRKGAGGSGQPADKQKTAGAIEPAEAEKAARKPRQRKPGARSKNGQSESALGRGLDLSDAVAKVNHVQVVLRKLGRGSRAVSGRLVRAPRKGSVIVIEFADGMHEYVTTAVKRVLRMAQKDVFYIETVNSRYRLEVRERDSALDDASSG